MRRFHDWQVRFERFARERSAMPFAWGSNDCTTFAADCIEALTGVKHLPTLRDYNSQLQAAQLLKAHDGVVGIATAALGEPVPVLMAQIGDVVLVDAAGSDMLAICNGSACMAPGPHGLVFIGMDKARMCWRVA